MSGDLAGGEAARVGDVAGGERVDCFTPGGVSGVMLQRRVAEVDVGADDVVFGTVVEFVRLTDEGFDGTSRRERILMTEPVASRGVDERTIAFRDGGGEDDSGRGVTSAGCGESGGLRDETIGLLGVANNLDAVGESFCATCLRAGRSRGGSFSGLGVGGRGRQVERDTIVGVGGCTSLKR